MKNTSTTFSTFLFLFTFTISSIGQNQFQSVKKITAGQGYSITPLVGDYDGDGDMDILGTGYYTKTGTRGNATVLLRNDGSEFVTVDTQLPSFYYGGMYQWADLDNDNDLDIIAAGCSYYCYNTKMLSIYRNDGADKFTLITQQTNLMGGELFSLVDYNNDGFIDIEIATQSDNDDSVIGHTFYRNTGNFVFQKTFDIPVSYGEVAWGDLDNDGWKDFVLLNRAYKNLHNGAFQAFNSSVTMQQNVRHFIFDADNDGDQDVITSNGILMNNDGHGQLSFGPVIIPFEYIDNLHVADFDGDGNRDMVASGGSVPQNGSGTQLFHSNGDGTFTAKDLNENYSYGYSLSVADIDNDKDPDILLSGVYIDEVVILENGLLAELSKPSVPANLQSLINPGAITFSWDAATDNEQSSTSLKYNLYLLYGNEFKIAPNADATTGASFIPGIANVPSAPQWQLSTSNLQEGYFQWSVQSVDNELNTSRFANPQEFTFYKNNPANAPTNLTRVAVEDRSLSLSWADNSNNETSFTIERSSLSGNAGFAPISQVASNTTNYTDNTILPRSVYFYRVRLDGSSALAYSNVIKIVTKSVIATAPVNAMANSLNSASAKIDWEYSGTGITGFVIERSPDDKKQFAIVSTVSTEKRTYTDQQLESGRTYYYRLYAVNGEDVSDYSNEVNVTVAFKEFNKITLSSLMYESTYIMGGIAWGDYDNDGFDDLFLGYKAQLFHNKGNGTFERIAETGITASGTHDFVAAWGDYDNDSFSDLFFYNNQDKSSIYRGHGDGTFTKILTAINSDLSEVTNATWNDFDMDGDLDLSMTGGRYIYRYDGSDTFVRVDLPTNPLSSNSSSVASWADFDDDGDPDVFWGSNGKDELFRNNGDGSFTPITDQRVTVDYNFDCCPIATPTALWTDFNNDRKLDLTIFHAGEPIYVYANHTNKFDSVFYSYEYNREPWKNLFWTDYDSDGDLDLFAMGQYNLKTSIWENKGLQPFSRVKGGPLFDYVLSDANFSWNDFDNDGYSDLFQFDSNHQVYKNLSNGNNWIKIRLKGRSSNSTGLGAKVFVKSDAGWQRSDVTTHHSFRVQQGFMSLFGVGKSTRVDSVKIIWPTGNRQYLTNVNVNQVILVDEEQAQEKVLQAPSNLTAEVVFPSSIILKWTDRSENEAGFAIEMATGTGQFTVVGTIGANVTSYRINSLSTGVIYKFRVRTAQALNSRTTNTVETQIRLFKDVFAGDLTTYQSKPGGMAWGDPDGDGDPDLFVGSESTEPDAIYYNNNGNFARNYLRSGSNYSRQAQWIDYDNDGYQDLHISVGGGIIASTEYLNDFLYKNNGSGQLVEQSGNILAKDGYPDFTAAWGDLNKDGFLDMIAARPDSKQPIFLNLGGNMTPLVPSGLNTQSEGIVLLSDLDNDRDLDLITTSLYGDPSIYENVNGQFSLLINSGLPYTGYSFVLEDFDNDGTQDLLMISQGQVLKLFLFDPVSKKFKEKANVFPQFSPVLKMSVGDFDNNGLVDLFVTGQVGFTSNTNRIFLNNGNLKFTSLTDPILQRNLFGSAIADVNKDGHLDVVTLASDNAYYDSKRYLLLGSKNENHWLRIKLRGVAINKFGIGARIRVFTGTTSQVRDIRSGTGGTFSDEQIAHFGLGTNTSIDYVKVEWPSGENQWIANPSIDTEMIVEQANTQEPASPKAPSNLVTVSRAQYVDLNWIDNSNNEAYFRIERALGNNTFEVIKNLPGNSTTFTDSTFLSYSGPRSVVKYRVTAIVFFDVKSDPSNEGSVFICSKPIVSSTIAATRCGPGSVTLQAATTDGTLNWYESPTGGLSIGTGSKFTTPSITSSVTYYVDDTNSCSNISTRTAVIASIKATPLEPLVTVNQPTCSVATGSISITVQNANDTYSFDNGVTFQSSNVKSGLTSGNYAVTIKNTTGCSSSIVIIPINPQPVSPMAPVTTVTQPTCSVATGSILVIGQNANDTYSFDNGVTFQSSNVKSGLASGNYAVIIKNTNGCSSSVVTIPIDPQPVSPVVSVTTVTQPTCSVATGSILVTVQNAGDTYSFDNGVSFQSNNVKSGLPSGNYAVIIKNTNGCSSSVVTIPIDPQPVSPVAPVTLVTQPTCSVATGSILVTVQNAGDTYSFDNGVSFQSSNTKPDVVSGSYTIVIKNSVGCTSQIAAIVNDPPEVPLKPFVILSGLNQEQRLLTASSASAYQWYKDGVAISGATTATYTATTSGSYNLIVFSGRGCASVASDPIVIIITGIENKSSELSIYPNPSKDWVTLSLPASHGLKHISIFDSNGRQIESLLTSAIELTIEVGLYSPGTYTINVNIEDSLRLIRFVKR